MSTHSMMMRGEAELRDALATLLQHAKDDTITLLPHRETSMDQLTSEVLNTRNMSAVKINSWERVFLSQLWRNRHSHASRPTALWLRLLRHMRR